MTRRSQRKDPECLRQTLVNLLSDFENKLRSDDLRKQVIGLVPANHLLRDLGSSLITDPLATAASDRILSYLRKYPKTLIGGEELMVVAGISEYARRIRELRVQAGWPILSGKALKHMKKEGGDATIDYCDSELQTDVYMLLADKQDRDASFRWNLANEIRKKNISVKAKILSYLRKNVGKRVSGEELKYLAKDRSEWARRVRELRTEDGWPVFTRVSGLPLLNVGEYVLEEDRQAEVHDRKIPDSIRVEVLERDSFKCKNCGWSYENRRAEDRVRNLIELHHIEHHSVGGRNVPQNLITLCNVCHDDVHRGNLTSNALIELLNQL